MAAQSYAPLLDTRAATADQFSLMKTNVLAGQGAATRWNTVRVPLSFSSRSSARVYAEQRVCHCVWADGAKAKKKIFLATENQITVIFMPQR